VPVLILLVSTLPLLTDTSLAETFTGQVVGIIDGDTMTTKLGVSD
jgi:hypothetical protein